MTDGPPRRQDSRRTLLVLQREVRRARVACLVFLLVDLALGAALLWHHTMERFAP